MHYRDRKYPYSGIFLNYDDDDYNQGYSQNKQALRALKKMISCNHIYQTMISDLPMLGLMMLVIVSMFSK